MGKYITVLLKLRNPKGKPVIGQIVVRDNFALSTFGDPKLARQIYEYDLNAGEDVAFNEHHNAYIKRYKKMKKEAIVIELKQEIQKAGGEVLK